MAKHAQPPSNTQLVQGLGLLDATTLVMGSMIGSGVFIVAADIGRQVGSPGLMMMTWVVTALMSLAGALCYGELAAAMPHAGGQYVYLREAFGPLSGCGSRTLSAPNLSARPTVRRNFCAVAPRKRKPCNS